MMTTAGLHYPTAIRKRVIGDWNCSQCQNLNFSFREECNRCGAHRSQLPVSKFTYALFLTPHDTPTPKQATPEVVEAAQQFSMEELPSVSPFMTEKCMTTPTEARPISSRLLQFEEEGCSQPQQASGDMQFFFGIKRPSIEKAGDWICPFCLNFNFAFRTACNRCQTAKTTQ